MNEFKQRRFRIYVKALCRARVEHLRCCQRAKRFSKGEWKAHWLNQAAHWRQRYVYWLKSLEEECIS